MTNPLLSPQDPISCDTGNMGCNGGYLNMVWYYMRNQGVVLESCFPYTAGSGYAERCISYCKNGAPFTKYYASNYYNLYSPSMIMLELVENGPVQTGFNVYSDFMNYSGGIYVHTYG